MDPITIWTLYRVLGFFSKEDVEYRGARPENLLGRPYNKTYGSSVPHKIGAKLPEKKKVSALKDVERTNCIKTMGRGTRLTASEVLVYRATIREPTPGS